MQMQCAQEELFEPVKLVSDLQRSILKPAYLQIATVGKTL